MKTIEVYAIRSNTLRYPDLFENDFKGGSSGCPGALRTRVNRASGYPDVNAHSLCDFLRLENGSFSSFRKLQKLSFALFLSCNSTIWFKSFPQSFINFESHLGHALTGPIFSRSMPSNAVIYSRELNLPNKTLTLSSSQQTSTKRKERMKESLKACNLTKKKKHLRISPTHSEYAAYNASGCLDTCKRRKRFDSTCVNAPKISSSLTSGYPVIWISGYVYTQPKMVCDH